jgi:hypothetical protein
MLRRKKPVLLNLEAPEAPRTVPQKLGETRFHAKKKMQVEFGWARARLEIDFSVFRKRRLLTNLMSSDVMLAVCRV